MTKVLQKLKSVSDNPLHSELKYLQVGIFTVGQYTKYLQQRLYNIRNNYKYIKGIDTNYLLYWDDEVSLEKAAENELGIMMANLVKQTQDVLNAKKVLLEHLQHMQQHGYKINLKQ